jgi:hypothetical protein
MALGETIGFSTRLTQNNGPLGLYRNQTNTYAGLVHIALMGDPTLRMHPVMPAVNLAGVASSSGIQLNWSGSLDQVIGYNVYRATDPSGPFARLNDSPLGGTTFLDTNAFSNTYTYMVRAIKLEQTPSGTYFNASQGIFTTLTALTPTQLVPVRVSSIVARADGVTLNWPSVAGSAYRVAFTSNLINTNWTIVIPDIQAKSQSLSWTDPTAPNSAERFYRVYEVR